MNIKKIIYIFIYILILVANSYADEFINVDDIHKGDTGYGLTVFEGVSVEKFNIEVIGILKNVMPKQDLILIRCISKKLEKSNIIAGMSGSPIYIKGKLAGALAYSWQFSKEPIAGVTPIGNMLDDSNRFFSIEKDIKSYIKNTNLKRINIPLSVSGLSDRCYSEASQFFKKYNLTLMQTGGGSSKEQDYELKQGAAAGIQLMSGDIDMTAIGTITYIDTTANKILLFGHPFLNSGKLEAPITSAIVHTVLPNLSVSFKIASPIKTIGATYGDNISAVAGILNKKPDMAIFHSEVVDDLGFKKEFNMKFIKNKSLTPFLINLALSNSILSHHTYTGDNVVDIDLTITLEDNTTINFKDTLLSLEKPNILFSIFKTFMLFQNPYKNIMAKKVDASIKLHFKNNLSTINKIYTDKEIYSPGEIIHGSVLLNKYNESEPIEIPFKIKIPENYSGMCILNIKSGLGMNKYEGKFYDFVSLKKFLESFLTANDLIILLSDIKRKKIAYRGNTIEDLPLKYNNLKRNTDSILTPDYKYKIMKTDNFLIGELIKKIIIKPKR